MYFIVGITNIMAINYFVKCVYVFYMCLSIIQLQTNVVVFKFENELLENRDILVKLYTPCLVFLKLYYYFRLLLFSIMYTILCLLQLYDIWFKYIDIDISGEYHCYN